MVTSSNSHAVPNAPPVTHETVVVDGVLRHPSTGLKVLVVGGGPGGYLTALECWRKGIDVEVLEKNSSNSPVGDVFFLNPSGLASLKYYPKLLDEYQRCSWDVVVNICKLGGGSIIPTFDFEWNRPDVPQHAAWPLRVRTMVARAPFTSMLYDQCVRLGIKVTFGVNVLSYSENAAEGTASIIVDDGPQFTADIVVAADGLGTKSTKIVLGQPMRATPTGFSIARVLYSLDQVQDSPLLDQLRHLKRPELRVASGVDFHFALGLANDAALVSITSLDNGTADESWAQGITPEEALSRVPDVSEVDPLIIELIRKIPSENPFVSWKLCWRNPQERWTSPGGRIVQVGDSAHTFIPTSLMGAATALEDAQSLAECLRLAGKKEAALGAKIHELLRHRRVTILQRSGFANRDESHQGGMEVVLENAMENDPFRMGKWVWTHNAESYATEKFSQARAYLEAGTTFEHTNIPPGFQWEPGWTMEGQVEKEKQGIKYGNLKLNGDWSIY
ncbi:hypothetical protein FOBRF1_013150 [Fusarium oxysporum]